MSALKGKAHDKMHALLLCPGLRNFHKADWNHEIKGSKYWQ